MDFDRAFSRVAINHLSKKDIAELSPPFPKEKVEVVCKRCIGQNSRDLMSSMLLSTKGSDI